MKTLKDLVSAITVGKYDIIDEQIKLTNCSIVIE